MEHKVPVPWQELACWGLSMGAARAPHIPGPSTILAWPKQMAVSPRCASFKTQVVM